jgi:uncharacterized protein (TIGR00730 family)
LDKTEGRDGTSITDWGKCCDDRNEEFLLQSRSYLLGDLRRTFQIMSEIVRGFFNFRNVGPCVTVYGSARFNQAHPYYEVVRQVGQELARAGFTVVTGGGPGLMEAANRGAKEANGRSIGCNIRLPKEQVHNPYLDQFLEFNYFFARKLILAKYSYAFIAAPGGFGTLDEIFEVLTLIQTGKMKGFPVILVGRDYWEPLVNFIKNPLLAQSAIDARDLELLWITDSANEAVTRVKEAVVTEFGLQYRSHH